MKTSRSTVYSFWIGAAVLLLAGCSGSPSSLAPTAPGQGAYVHRGVPFLPAIGHANALHRLISPDYRARKSLVFEADQVEAAVNIYKTGALANNPAPIATIHVAAGCPYGMAMDKTGTLYVVDNCSGNDVELYPKGSTKLKSTITDGISNPLGAAIDKNGTLYVSNYPASITEYAYGTDTPSQTITGGGMIDPFGLALDKAGNLYIADFGADQVFELTAGSTTVKALDLADLEEPLGVAIDQRTGYLWVTDNEGKKVNVYPPGSTSPIESITGFDDPYAISIQHQGPEKTVISDLSAKAVYAYEPNQYKAYATLTTDISFPTGLLIAKP
jgi:hypothetical protein